MFVLCGVVWCVVVGFCLCGGFGGCEVGYVFEYFWVYEVFVVFV